MGIGYNLKTLYWLPNYNCMNFLLNITKKGNHFNNFFLQLFDIIIEIITKLLVTQTQRNTVTATTAFTSPNRYTHRICTIVK